MKRRKNGNRPTDRANFIKGAFWIAFGGFAAKLLGALYRIPLTNLIGGYGLGLYQMIYPVYCMLLTFSATGVPSAVAKLTAEQIADGGDGRDVLRSAAKLFLCVGVAATLLMCALAFPLSAAQGTGAVVGGYFWLAPSVVFVSLLAVLRGWFQGRNDMFPTAASEIAEQLVKTAFGLLFAYRFRANTEKAVTALFLAVTLSEVCALLFLFALYRRVPKTTNGVNVGGRYLTKRILKLTVPLAFGSVLLPISALLDSVLVPKLLAAYAPSPVSLYGLFSGGAATVVGLPVSVCYGLAAASLPRVAAATRIENARERKRALRKRVLFSLACTAFFGGIAAVGLYLFAEPAVRLIFRGLSATDGKTLTELIRAHAVGAFLLPCAQTLSACLTAQGKPQYAALSLLFGVAAKTACCVLWVRQPKFSVFGLAYATNVCYSVAFFLNFVYNIVVWKKTTKEGKAG